jgi:hypothetical protein
MQKWDMERGKNWSASMKLNGRRIVKSFGQDRDDAERPRSEILARRSENGRLRASNAEETSFARAADGYLAERPTLKYSTLCSYRYILKNICCRSLAII